MSLCVQCTSLVMEVYFITGMGGREGGMGRREKEGGRGGMEKERRNGGVCEEGGWRGRG